MVCRGYSVSFALCLLLTALQRVTQAFVMPKSRQPAVGTSRQQLWCICVDCAHVTNCSAYHFVESKHEQPHMTEHPTFTPRDGSPTIHVNVRTVRSSQDAVARIWKEHAAETKRAEQQQQQQEGDLRGETVYELTPVTTYEYDVVACQDFVLDKGCWVRNMPEEIKKANPNFVPT